MGVHTCVISKSECEKQVRTKKRGKKKKTKSLTPVVVGNQWCEEEKGKPRCLPIKQAWEIESHL